MAPMDQAKAAEQIAKAEADKHLDAIDAILSKSTTGALTKDGDVRAEEARGTAPALLKGR